MPVSLQYIPFTQMSYQFKCVYYFGSRYWKSMLQSSLQQSDTFELKAKDTLYSESRQYVFLISWRFQRACFVDYVLEWIFY